MKVSIITLHNVKNYGSVLQTYATQVFFERLGFDVEVVDYYRPDVTESDYIESQLKRSRWNRNVVLRMIYRLIYALSYGSRRKVFRPFVEENLSLTGKHFSSYEHLLKAPPQADVYCVGSDQVWNSTYNQGILPEFFLQYAPPGKLRIAFSSSFGKEMLEDWEIDETCNMLATFHAISVREHSAKDIINGMGLAATNILDPTLLLSGDDWLKFAAPRQSRYKYILVYTIENNKNADKYARELAREKGLKLLRIGYGYHNLVRGGRLICYPSVKQFISLIYNAEYVVTDSFHATAFSINFNRPFNVIMPARFTTRIKSILDLTLLSDRVISDYKDLSASTRQIDYFKINSILATERRKAVDFVEEAIAISSKASVAAI